MNVQPTENGVALGLTLAVSYTVCAVASALWPENGIDFLNALFHGLDFRKLAVATPMTFSTFFYPLVILTLWGFAVGTLYAWLQRRLSGKPANR